MEKRPGEARVTTSGVLVRPLEEADRPAAGVVLAAAFPDKLAAMVGDRRGLARALRGEPPEYPYAAALFADLLHMDDPPAAWVAERDGCVVGVVEVRDPGRPAARPPVRRILRRHLGPWRTLRALLFQTIFHMTPLSADRLHVDVVAVHPAARGGGVGSNMVRFLLEEAARRGKVAVTLYCIDRNEGARRLYRRLGFVVWRHERLGALRFILGFAATDLMRAEVAAGVDGEPAGISDATAQRDPGRGVAQVSRNGAGTRLV